MKPILTKVLDTRRQTRADSLFNVNQYFIDGSEGFVNIRLLTEHLDGLGTQVVIL